MKPTLLVVMRLSDMHKVHPAQDNSKVCPSCGERVGIYPSGQMALKYGVGVEIICQVCSEKLPPSDLSVLAPGALEEIGESVPAKKP